MCMLTRTYAHNHDQSLALGGAEWGRGGHRGNQEINEVVRIVNRRTLKRHGRPAPPSAPSRPGLDDGDVVGGLLMEESLPGHGRTSSGLGSGSGLAVDADAAAAAEFAAAEEGDGHAGGERWIPAVCGAGGAGRGGVV